MATGLPLAQGRPWFRRGRLLGLGLVVGLVAIGRTAGNGTSAAPPPPTIELR